MKRATDSLRNTTLRSLVHRQRCPFVRSISSLRHEVTPSKAAIDSVDLQILSKSSGADAKLGLWFFLLEMGTTSKPA